ncbi:2-dehydro-3-deoxy-6-phosphogalactonate aldolase [Paracoccus fistulariae]|uniref:2-dehydro-3-deoxy-6-phosphogalactonate aldolase n=1 Tax=Paracoccus fistulariae TaxID=658446 RepID=A0ABY7SND2_9RHOB|nr:2-dehydro-3-deoxy-6-phosphogalactonate aldolase [Paracoccus fistulariae]MDB6180416.1 2-dehydro-3-deoxy-6-phosphogalactonate aldolase [Paracoccus fistulariae]WCR08495.1 2-dehydro-3-deoxy-6-phosphogalactonate aldolase [Paracoccus fistulariae]
MTNWQEAFDACPLVAILRGVRPVEVLAIGKALTGAGFTLIEVPLNSPDPLNSISRLVQDLPQAVVGAGTVLSAQDVTAVKDAGGRLIVAPNFDPEVAAEAARHQMIYLPGIGTLSEAFAALKAGAAGLKLFPAEMIPPAAVKAMRSVLPADAKLLPVGGVNADTMPRYWQAGANGFGMGQSLYRPGQTAEETATRAADFIATWRAVAGQG